MKTLTLNNGIAMPALGLGVYQSSPSETIFAVRTAIESGYRLIDTAAAYFNEKQVGEGIRQSGFKRSDVFVTTKLWISDYGTEATLKAFEASLRRLGTDYVDMYLLHQPMPAEFEKTVAAYNVAEKLLQEGRVRVIGVCNFGVQHIQNLIDRTDIVPMVNQVELNPFFIQEELRNVHSKLGIVSQAWSPLGGVNVYWEKDPSKVKFVLQHPIILNLAKKYNRTPAQVVLRWHLDQGISAIPKSVHAERIRENFNVFDFSLTNEELKLIDTIDTGKRAGPDPEIMDTIHVDKRVDNSIEADSRL